MIFLKRSINIQYDFLIDCCTYCMIYFLLAPADPRDDQPLYPLANVEY